MTDEIKTAATKTADQKNQQPEMDESKKLSLEEVVKLKERINLIRSIAKIGLCLALIPILISIFSPLEMTSRFGLWVLVLFFVSFMAWYFSHSVKIIKAWENGVVFRLGKQHSVRKPGLRFILWPLDKIIFVKMWAREIDIPRQIAITTDGNVEIDGVVYFKVKEADKFLTEVHEPVKMIIDLSLASFRSAAGIRTTDELKKDNDQISGETEKSLNEAVEPWGLKITQAKLTDIRPPKIVADAMEKLAATKKEAEAVVAKAEGDAKAVEVGAKAVAFKVKTEAEGQAAGFKALIGALGKKDPEKVLVALKALEALQKGEKVYLPPELANIQVISDILKAKEVKEKS
jgi:regulator of protease activity HflC (stomatin/prohibitin superfamily)